MPAIDRYMGMEAGIKAASRTCQPRQKDGVVLVLSQPSLKSPHLESTSSECVILIVYAVGWAFFLCRDTQSFSAKVCCEEAQQGVKDHSEPASARSAAPSSSYVQHASPPALVKPPSDR